MDLVEIILGVGFIVGGIGIGVAIGIVMSASGTDNGAEDFCPNYFVNDLTSYAGWYCPTENNTAKEFVCDESGECYYTETECRD